MQPPERTDPDPPAAPDDEGGSGPTPPATKRLVGLLLAGFGGLMMCIGALMPWVRTSLVGAPANVSPTYYGIDLPDGKVVLALGVVVLIALLVTRMASASLARTAALVIIIASFAGVGVTAVTLISAESRFKDSAVEDLLAQVDDPTAEMRSQIEELIDLQLSAGPFAVIGGGILAMAGGALTLAWARTRGRTDTPDA